MNKLMEWYLKRRLKQLAKKIEKYQKFIGRCKLWVKLDKAEKKKIEGKLNF